MIGTNKCLNYISERLRLEQPLGKSIIEIKKREITFSHKL